MAETTTPSVRGRLRTEVMAALAVGAVSSAALAGLAAGVAGEFAREAWHWAVGRPSGPHSLSTVSAFIAAALALDLMALVRGRPQPFTLGRQVPKEWGRLLDPRLVAVLYGARLGVGPLTILSTWCWWAVVVAAAGVGVWSTVVVSVWFAATRVVLNQLVSAYSDRPTAGHDRPHGVVRARRFQRLIGVQNPSRVAIGALTLGLVVATVAVGCGQRSTSSPDAAQATTTSAPTTTGPPTSLAYLEDVVRTPNPTSPAVSTPMSVSSDPGSESSGDTPTRPVAVADQSPQAAALSAALPADLLGMPVVDDPAGNRYLTLEQAADIQPDPSEETALLETRGYQGGWIRAFRAETDDIAVTSVYQFKDATEAEFYLEDGLITIGGHGGQFFEVPSLPAVRGFKQSFDVDGEQLTTLGGAFFHGARWYLLYIVGTQRTATADVLVPALAELYETATAS